jgi:hypothetical protein
MSRPEREAYLLLSAALYVAACAELAQPESPELAALEMMRRSA